MRKRKVWKKIAACTVVVALLLQNQGITYAAENEKSIQGEIAPEDSLTIDEETGLKMQTMTLEESDEDYSFDMDAHLALADRKEVNARSDVSVLSTYGYDNTMIQNDYVEFVVRENGDLHNDETTDGRFTIGTVEGNPNYSSDNNQILLFGHPNPWSSFTTIQINGTNYIFKADSTVYDMENRKATSTMTVSGVKVVQTLQIVKNDSTGLEDTVHISYATINLTSTSKRVGVRIMMDTMLGNNDGAPFRIPSRGEVTKELELVGSQVPAYWQAFDNLSDPSVFAIGTIYKGNQSRKPDKVQFASWGGIYATTWDYTINTDRKVTNDSAVAFYWNPITLASGSTNTVETYYGAGLSSNGGIDDVPIEFDTKDKYVVLVTKNSGKELLAGATVQIEGVGTAVTNENGIATFSSNLPISSYASRKQMTISCNGYRTKDVFRMVSKDRSSAVGMVADNGKPYVKSISLIGTDGGSFSEYVDLMSENYSVEADSKAAETSYYEIRITATSNGKGNVGRYKIIQDNVVILQEDITRDTRTVRLMKSKLKAGKRVYVQIETTDGSLSDKIATTLLVNPQKTILGEDSKDTEGSIKLGGSGVGFKIPNDAVAFGGMELNMDMPGLPIEFEAFDDGTVKVSVGLDEFGNTWEEKEEKWDELFAKYERGSNLQSVFTNDQGTTSWKIAGGFDVSFVGKGYAEGKIDDYGNCNVDLMLILGVKGEYEYTQQYIVGYIPLGFEFKVGVKGTYTVGGTLTVGKNLANERVFDFTGNKGKIDIDIYASLYGGLGLVGVLTVGGEGEAHLLLGYDFQQQYYDAKVKGSIALSAKAFMFSAKYVIAERTWNITSGYITKSSADQQSIYEVFYDRSSYSMMSREYLSANPNRSDVAAEMESFFQNVYPGASQKIVMVDGTPYMFWLADDINRTEANRTSLVYSKYDGEWSEPVAVKDDGTADFNFDVVSDGSKIHIVWQDMAVEFGGSSWNNMSDADRLTEMARNSDISYACIDTSADMAVSTKVTSQNGYADMLPKITVNSGLPYVVWYTNESNDILTQSGNTTLNMAAITYDSVSVANYSSEDEEEIDQEEIDTEEEDMEEEDGEAEEDTGDTDTEDTDTREEDFESADTEEESSGDTDTEDTDGREEVPEGTNTEEESSGDMDTEEIDSEAAFRLYVFESEREEPDSLDDTTEKEENAETEDESNSETEDQDEKSETDEEHSEEENAETGGDSEEETEDESNSETEDQDEKLETDEEHSEEENAETGDDSEAEENSNEDGSEKELDEERTVQSGIDGSDEESVDINEKIFTGIISTICSLEGTPVVSVDIGSLGNKLTVAYVLDNDKNLNTIEDHDLYLWDASTDSVGFKTSNDICDENPQFSPDGMALYWYADGQIYYVTGNTAGASVNAVLPEGAVAASSNFCITNDNSVLWAGSSISAMNIIQYNIYKSDNADGGYSSAYKIVTSELNSIGDITAIENGGEAYVAYLLNYLDDDAADIAFEKISSVADLALDNVDIDHTSVQSSAATDFELSLTNNGSTDISTITINVLNTSTNESSSWIENVDLPRGESAIYELSHTFIGDLSEVNDYLFTVTANEESDDRKGDNSQIVKIGYTDISVKSTPYYSDSSYFSNVVIQNNTGMLAADTVLRVRADEKEGAILYEKSFGTLDAYKEYALQLDLFSIAGNADVDELYITLDTSSEDFIEENNTEMEYLHFLWREEEPYPLHLVIQKGESKITEELGNYYVDDIVKVKSDPLRGYDFAGWSTSDGGYFYDSGSEDTYFSMPNCETTLIASYIPNAFLITEQEIAVGESILIAPVYDGIWECKGSEDIAKIRYSGNVAKITGLSDGEITLRYIGKETSDIKEIRVSVYALDSITILSDNVADGVLKMRPSDVETLRAQGVTVNGKAVELPNVTWTVSNSKIAKVDDIVVTADKKGSTQLTAQVGVYKTTIPLEVQVPVSSITVTNSSGNSYIPIGKTIKLKAKVTGYRGNTPNDSKVKWESSDNSVASVNSSGVVTAHRVGSAEITAKSRDGSGKIGYYNVDVTKRVSKITARYKKLYGYKNTSTNLTNYINIPSVSKYAVKWKSSNSSVVSVSGYYAHLKKSGTATMTGSYDGKSVKFKIEVREYAENISISGSDYLTVGRNTILKAKPANKAYNKKVSWSVYSAFDANGDRVSASKIATITRNGKLSAYAAGYVYVRASASDGGGAYTTKRIDISEPVKSIEWSNVTSKSQTVTVGSSILLKTLTKDKYGDIIKGAVTYTSSSSKVASVASRASYDGSNVIYANAKGIAKVKASYGGKSVTYKIKVVQPVSSVTISGASAVAVGNKENYKAIYSPTTANIKKVDWEIIQAYDVNGDPQEDTSRIATIENGTLKAVAEGKVTIRIKAKDGYDAHDTKTVIITKEAGALELSESNLTIALGKSKKIEYNLFDQNSQEMNDSYIVWKSSNPGVADITNGIITAHKKGSAQITASYAGKRATIKVKVVQPAEDINIVGSAVLTVGKSSTYKVTVLPKTVNNKKVDWMITKAYDAFDDNVPNPDAIATVSSKGVVKAVSSGTIYLRASAQDGYKAEAEIKIKIYGTPDSMVITGRDTLSPNASTTLMATVFDSNMDCIENSKVTWSSGDKKIVKVDSFGKVTALKPGSTTVTAKCGKIKVSYNITVQ